nr:PEP/pyruvate-binding domain-containing protein [Antrihabitans sp. YC2-6]
MTTAIDPIVVLDGSSSGGRQLLGGKAWSIQQMLALGIPVPPAFVITTDVCRHFHESGGVLPDDIWQRVPAAMAGLERYPGERSAHRHSPCWYRYGQVPRPACRG